MIHSNPFNGRSTADHVLAGIDLTGRRFVVTGCNSGIGFETMHSLAANGAHVVGLAKSWSAAREACARVGPTCTAVACDLSDLDSVADAADAIRALNAPVDAVIANAGTAYLPTLRTRYGVEMQFLVNHIGHFALVKQLCEMVRNGTGRIVLVSGATGISGELWTDCRITEGPALLADADLAGHLWEVSERIVDSHNTLPEKLRDAA